MELHRQELPKRRDDRPEPPQRVPERRPPLLGDWFIYLSVIVLICGVVAISALELGSSFGDPIVRVPALIACALLIVVCADAAVRVWRSAWTWLPVDRGRGLFRFVWTGVIAAAGVTSMALLVALLLA